MNMAVRGETVAEPNGVLPDAGDDVVGELLPDAGGGVTFTVGELFQTYDMLERKLDEYKQKNFVELWKRDARTIEAARKRIDRPLKAELKYYEVKFCCIHGGQSFKSKGKGMRSTS